MICPVDQTIRYPVTFFYTSGLVWLLCLAKWGEFQNPAHVVYTLPFILLIYTGVCAASSWQVRSRWDDRLPVLLDLPGARATAARPSLLPEALVADAESRAARPLPHRLPHPTVEPARPGSGSCASVGGAGSAGRATPPRDATVGDHCTDGAAAPPARGLGRRRDGVRAEWSDAWPTVRPGSPQACAAFLDDRSTSRHARATRRVSSASSRLKRSGSSRCGT